MKFLLLILSLASSCALANTLDNCSLPLAAEQVDSLVSLLENARVAPRCGEIPVGGLRLNNRENQGRVRERYFNDTLIKRVSQNQYEAILNLNFVSAGGALSSSAMQSRIQACLNAADQSFKGPNGESLKILIYTPAEIRALNIPGNQKPRSVDIRLTAGSSAISSISNTLTFPDDMDCPAVVHELFHHLGLADECLETRPEYVKMWSCRPRTGNQNLMNNSWFAFRSSVPRRLNCECGEECKLALASSNPNLRSIYFGRNPMHILPEELQQVFNPSESNYRSNCTSGAFSQPQDISSLPRPDMTTILLNDDGDQIVLEGRSLMADGKIMTYPYTCPCLPGNPAMCQHMKDQVRSALSKPARSAICPTNGTPPLEYSDRRDDEQSPYVTENIEPHLQGGNVVYTSEPVVKSLITPNQFNRVIHGTCPEASGNYLNCSEMFRIPQGKECDASMREQCQSSDFYHSR